MSETTLTYLIISFIFLTLFFAIKSAYWKAKYEELKEHSNNNNNGWENEARFLRRIVNSEAAEAIDNIY